MTAPTLRNRPARATGAKSGAVFFLVQHGKIQKSQRVLATPLRRGTGISSPVRVYPDSATTANSHTSPSGEVQAMMDFIFTSEFQARFWAKVDKRSPDECWEWRGCRVKGYGTVTRGTRNFRAHRIAYELHKGNIPEGFVLDHLCRNRGCVNPSHLEAVTNRENVLRGESFTAKHALKTHCSKGHPLPESTGIARRGRVCKQCKADWNAERSAKRAARKQEKIRNGELTKKGLPTHCKHGHLLEGDNVRLYKGARICRACKAKVGEAWRAKHSA